MGLKTKCTEKLKMVVQNKVVLPCACEGGVCEVKVYFY